MPRTDKLDLNELAGTVLEAVWDSLPLYTQRRMSKELIEQRITKAIANGERDGIRLRAAALDMKIIPFSRS